MLDWFTPIRFRGQPGEIRGRCIIDEVEHHDLMTQDRQIHVNKKLGEFEVAGEAPKVSWLDLGDGMWKLI